MKKVSDTYKKLGIDFTFPIYIKNANGKETYYENNDGFRCKYEYDNNGKVTYYENSDRYWSKCEYDANGNKTYFKNSNDSWCKIKYDANGNKTYCETSKGYEEDTPRSQSCAGKVIEVDGKKYKLTEL